MNLKSNLSTFVARAVTWLTVFVIATPSAFAESGSPACRVAVAGLATASGMAKYLDHEMTYTSVAERGRYKIDRDLPGLRDSVLLHITATGHALVWYKGRRLDSRASGLVGVHAENRHTGQALPQGLLFAITQPPADFEARFAEYVEGLQDVRSLTCIHAACRHMAQLGLFEPRTARFVKATTLLKYILTLDESAKQRLGLQVIALGVSPEDVFLGWEKKEETMLAEYRLYGGALVLPAVGLGVAAYSLGVFVQQFFGG